MSERKFPDDVKIGDLVVLTKEGLEHIRRTYRSHLTIIKCLDYLVYFKVIDSPANPYKSITVDWIDYKGKSIIKGCCISRIYVVKYERS